jgi:hypothetical protein
MLHGLDELVQKERDAIELLRRRARHGASSDPGPRPLEDGVAVRGEKFVQHPLGVTPGARTEPHARPWRRGALAGVVAQRALLADPTFSFCKRISPGS